MKRWGTSHDWTAPTVHMEDFGGPWLWLGWDGNPHPKQDGCRTAYLALSEYFAIHATPCCHGNDMERWLVKISNQQSREAVHRCYLPIGNGEDAAEKILTHVRGVLAPQAADMAKAVAFLNVRLESVQGMDGDNSPG